MFRVIYMYVCPICKKRLRKLDNVWHCQNGHSFDIARKGYVNLLTTKGRNPKNAGDNAEMVKARTDFLDRDYYLPLAKKTAEVMGVLLENVKQPYIIDSGCGEGFYTVNYAKALPKAKFYGIDISKAAVSNDEYARVLKDGGKLVVVSPSPRHLFELKEVLYEKPYENKPNVYGLNKFDESEEMIFEYPVVLESHEDIFNLFTMTPYYYKTSAEAVEKLKKVNRLELTCGFSIRTFTKKRGF